MEVADHEVKHKLLNMEDKELELDLDNVEEQTEKNLKVKERFAKISEKATLANKGKEEAEAKAKAESDRATALAKERDFYKEFSANSGKYPNSSQYQDKILEKVKAGYSTEDAIVSVLNAEGKLTPVTQETPPIKTSTREVAGGSAMNQITDPNKSVEKMTRAEMRAQLAEAERRGEISTM